MARFTTELRYAWRSLLRRPAYLIACAGTLALVPGANAATLAVVSATVLRPLPFGWVLCASLARLILNVEPISLFTLVTAAAILAVVALLAALIPALRVLRVQPSDVLKA